MASIIKRKKSYSVVYNYTDENGEVKQKWETCRNHQDALKRKAEEENDLNKGTFIPPNDQTVREFLYDFVTVYGEQKWGVSMYDMITDIYAHILDEDRKINAQKSETAFYGTRDLRDVRNPDAVPLPVPGADESKQQTFDLASLIEQLQKNPELATTLAALITNGSNACS